jgi:hypothetical protein
MAKRSNRSVLLAALWLSAATLFAQDAPVTPAPKPQATTASSAPAADDADALAKATQNPVASLISVPIQNNSNFAVGPYNRTQDVLNIQPVIPARISENWMLISNHSANRLAALRR